MRKMLPGASWGQRTVRPRGQGEGCCRCGVTERGVEQFSVSEAQNGRRGRWTRDEAFQSF